MLNLGVDLLLFSSSSMMLRESQKIRVIRKLEFIYEGF